MHEISFERVESRRPLHLNIAPDAEELRDLAARFGWVRVDGLKGAVVLTRTSPTSWSDARQTHCGYCYGLWG